MIILTEFKLVENPGKGVFVRSSEQNSCPCCGSELKVIGSRVRKYINRIGENVALMIRRLRCSLCSRVHHELPDILVPYKRYGSESIEAVVNKVATLTVAADESTIGRWKRWFLDAQSPMTLILVGQSELRDKFQLQSYAAIRQRIDLQCKLTHLDRAQVGEYMKRHLDYGGATQDIFSDSAIDEVFRLGGRVRFSGGSARLVNKVFTQCMIYGAQNGRRIIDDHMVKLVIQGELL